EMSQLPRATDRDRLFPDLGFGLGLRARHYSDVLGKKAASARRRSSWFEIISENYMHEGGRPLHYLDQIRADFPIVCHGVSLNIGSVDPLDLDHVKRLKALVDRCEPSIISDHLCWTGVNGKNLHDLLPLPYTREVLDHVAARVRQVQDLL